VLDEVMFGPLQIRMDKETARKKALEAIETAGLTGLEHTNPYDLGLSLRKLVAIASILAMDTETVILDEPTIAQDFAGKQRIKSMIQMLRERGRTVITITHDMNFVADNFERAIVFAKGCVLRDGATKDVFQQKDALEEACLEQPDVMKLCYELGYRKVTSASASLSGIFYESTYNFRQSESERTYRADAGHKLRCFRQLGGGENSIKHQFYSRIFSPDAV
jgi:energy-coupling factor transport system ATP-binding protein